MGGSLVITSSLHSAEIGFKFVSRFNSAHLNLFDLFELSAVKHFTNNNLIVNAVNWACSGVKSSNESSPICFK